MSEDLQYLRKVSKGTALILDTLRWYDGEERPWVIYDGDYAEKIDKIVNGIEESIPNYRYRLKVWLKNYEFFDTLGEIASTDTVPEQWKDNLQKFLIYEYLCGPDANKTINEAFGNFIYELEEGHINFAWDVIEETPKYQKALVEGLLKKGKYKLDGDRIYTDPSLSDSPVIIIRGDSGWVDIEYGKTIKVELISVKEVLRGMGHEESLATVDEIYETLKQRKQAKPVQVSTPIPISEPSYEPVSIIVEPEPQPEQEQKIKSGQIFVPSISQEALEEARKLTKKIKKTPAKAVSLLPPKPKELIQSNQQDEEAITYDIERTKHDPSMMDKIQDELEKLRLEFHNKPTEEELSIKSYDDQLDEKFTQMHEKISKLGQIQIKSTSPKPIVPASKRIVKKRQAAKSKPAPPTKSAPKRKASLQQAYLKLIMPGATSAYSIDDIIESERKIYKEKGLEALKAEIELPAVYKMYFNEKNQKIVIQRR